MKKKVAWITTPPIDNDKNTSLNKLVLKTTPLIITKAKEYDIDVIDLNEHLKNDVSLRTSDGVHWKSEGQRLMTQYLTDYIAQLPKQNLVNTSNQLK